MHCRLPIRACIFISMSNFSNYDTILYAVERSNAWGFQYEPQKLHYAKFSCIYFTTKRIPQIFLHRYWPKIDFRIFHHTCNKFSTNFHIYIYRILFRISFDVIQLSKYHLCQHHILPSQKFPCSRQNSFVLPRCQKILKWKFYLFSINQIN